MVTRQLQWGGLGRGSPGEASSPAREPQRSFPQEVRLNLAAQTLVRQRSRSQSQRAHPLQGGELISNPAIGIASVYPATCSGLSQGRLCNVVCRCLGSGLPTLQWGKTQNLSVPAFPQARAQPRWGSEMTCVEGGLVHAGSRGAPGIFPNRWPLSDVMLWVE